MVSGLRSVGFSLTYSYGFSLLGFPLLLICSFVGVFACFMHGDNVVFYPLTSFFYLGVLSRPEFGLLCCGLLSDN